MANPTVKDDDLDDVRYLQDTTRPCNPPDYAQIERLDYLTYPCMLRHHTCALTAIYIH